MKIRKVLLVDDDSAIRKIVQLTLSRTAGWEVILADCGARGVELAAEQNPDVIILDMMMPGMDGPATLRLINKNLELQPLIPILFMTAKVQRHELASYQSMGAAGVISKPFDPMTLASDIEKLVRIFYGDQPCGANLPVKIAV